MRKQAIRFKEFVEALAIGSAEELPLVHTTSAYSFDDISEANEIRAPKKCRHFGEELIYFYYGRPAYRTQASKSAKLRFNYPFIFIFDPGKVTEIKRIFPFDTGAFDDGRYAKFFDKNAEMTDFELSGRLDNAKKLSEGIYGSPVDYLLGRMRKNIDVPLRGFEAQGVVEQARLPPYLTSERADEDTLDERASSIEIQVESPFDIQSALMGLIIPELYLEDEMTIKAIDRWSPKVLKTYRIVESHSPGSWMSLIYHEVLNAYEELGYLDGS